MPENGVLTPLALLTADLVKAPQVGIPLNNEPIMLHNPNANISCDASRLPSVANVQETLTIFFVIFVEKFVIYQKPSQLLHSLAFQR